MSNGNLQIPNLDDRTWQQLVDDAKKLIPRYAPDWTDHNPSDLGITLIELFAWIGEQIIYRLNRVPEKNYVEFLNLIGVTRYPPTPAQTDITFKINGDAVVTVPKWTQVSTPPIGTEDGIIFETDEELNAVNLKKCLFFFLDASDNKYKYKNHTTKIIAEPYQQNEFVTPVAGKTFLLLGFASATTLTLSITCKIASGSVGIQPIWRYSRPAVNNEKSLDKLPSVVPITNAGYAFEKSARVGIQIPADWQAQAPSEWDATPATPEDEVKDSLFWLAIQWNAPATRELKIKLNRLAANMISSSNVVKIVEEPLGKSDGKPFQTFSLRHTPLYEDRRAPDPLGHLSIAVKEPNSDWKNWKRVEDFSRGGAAEYLCNPVTGEISLGNFPPPGNPDQPVAPSDQSIENSDQPRFGRIPPEGSEIKAVSYRYVAGGSTGNIPAKTIVIQRTPVADGVVNEEAAQGGSDWEKIEDTKRRGPKSIKNQNRAVTAEDYEIFARAATTDVAKARCFPPKRKTENEWITEPFDRTPGRVNLILAPNEPNSRQPNPTPDLFNEVKNYLDTRRTITSLIFLHGPYYVEIKIPQATVFVKPGEDVANLKRTIRQKLYDFFHPLTGGPNGRGWEIGQDLYVPDVFAVMAAVPEISYVADLKIEGIYQNDPVPATGVRLEIKDYQLVCAAALNDANYVIKVEEEKPEI